MKINVAQNMIARLRWLDTLSHTVRLAAGTVDDGKELLPGKDDRSFRLDPVSHCPPYEEW